MEKLGEELRSERVSGSPPTTETSMSLPFDMDLSPVVRVESRSTQTGEGSHHISFEIELLRSFLSNEQGVSVRKVEKSEGRSKGGRNIISVSFVPESLATENLLSEYLSICAAVKGFDGENSSVDTIIGLVEDSDTLVPYIALQSDLRSYRELDRGLIDYQRWPSQVEISQLQDQ
jgi:hypothetical protein